MTYTRVRIGRDHTQSSSSCARASISDRLSTLRAFTRSLKRRQQRRRCALRAHTALRLRCGGTANDIWDYRARLCIAAECRLNWVRVYTCSRDATVTAVSAAIHQPSARLYGDKIVYCRGMRAARSVRYGIGGLATNKLISALCATARMIGSSLRARVLRVEVYIYV